MDLDPKTLVVSVGGLPVRLTNAFGGARSADITVGELRAAFANGRIPRNVGRKTIREAEDVLTRCGVDVHAALAKLGEPSPSTGGSRLPPKLLVDLEGVEWTVTADHAMAGRTRLSREDLVALLGWVDKAAELAGPPG